MLIPLCRLRLVPVAPDSVQHDDGIGVAGQLLESVLRHGFGILVPLRPDELGAPEHGADLVGISRVTYMLGPSRVGSGAGSSSGNPSTDPQPTAAPLSAARRCAPSAPGSCSRPRLLVLSQHVSEAAHAV